MKDYLPLGSVVLLEGAKKSLIIIGTMQIDEDGKEYDYISCTFPEGYIDDETFFLFNEEDIVEVKFIGYVNAETQMYSQALKNAESSDYTDDVRDSQTIQDDKEKE